MRKYYNKHVVTEFEQTDAENCTICKALNDCLKFGYFQDNYWKLTNLVRGNLKRHLASNKHWKMIYQLDRKTNVVYWRERNNK